MKTVNITADQPELRKLVEQACDGEPVILAYGDKKVKLEPFVAVGGAVDLDLQEDSPELEAELLKAVRSPLTPYSRRDLDEIEEQVGHSEIE
ncbi:MAG: hypothetical protein C5B50_19695 [Verrucomicrobia bacterium]|nr:MAG: hypothetical protein C5B50_19695 [Verrucomicrobiota bacterium]